MRNKILIFSVLFILLAMLSESQWYSSNGGGGGGTPGGADTQVQFNDGGVFGGDADLIWNKTSNFLAIGADPADVGTIRLPASARIVAEGVFESSIDLNDGSVILNNGNNTYRGNSSRFDPSTDNIQDLGSNIGTAWKDIYFGTSIRGTLSGAHINQFDATSDIAGTITVTNPATTGTYTFATAFTSAPACVITPITTPSAVDPTWVTTSTTAVTANVTTSPAASIVFNFVCVGNPN